jgi:ABC-type nitrate/sulfonate/bicarbonate transport system ATPase subunit
VPLSTNKIKKIIKSHLDMADPKGIQRKLWFDGKKGREVLAQDELLKRTEPLVILGEAGMGKTHLLQWLSSFTGVSWCKARQLINRGDPRTLYKDGTILVIDALDEVSAQKE